MKEENTHDIADMEQQTPLPEEETPMEIELEMSEPLDEEPKQPEPKAPRNKKEALWGAMLTDEDDEVQGASLTEVLRSFQIDGQWFRRQLGVICLIVLFVIVYVTNRYQAQQEIIEQDALKIELEDWKYRAITRSSELTDICKQSQIESALRHRGDSTLRTAVVPPYVIIKQE